VPQSILPDGPGGTGSDGGIGELMPVHADGQDPPSLHPPPHGAVWEAITKVPSSIRRL